MELVEDVCVRFALTDSIQGMKELKLIFPGSVLAQGKNARFHHHINGKVCVCVLLWGFVLFVFVFYLEQHFDSEVDGASEEEEVGVSDLGRE